MKRILTIVLAICCVWLTGCHTTTEVNEGDTDFLPAETVAETESETVPFDEAVWERVIDWNAEDEVSGADPITGMAESYTAFWISARVTDWTDGECTAEILALSWDNYLPLVDAYFAPEAQRYAQEGDTLKLSFSENTLICCEWSHYTAYVKAMPTEDYLPIGTIMNFLLNKADSENVLYTDYVCFGEGYDEDYVNDEKEYMRQMLEEEEVDIGVQPQITELPYAVMQIDKWLSSGRYDTRFNATVLETSDTLNTSYVKSGKFYKFYEVNFMYTLPDKGIFGFDAPWRNEFPEGSVLKVYYLDEYGIPVYAEPLTEE